MRRRILGTSRGRIKRFRRPAIVALRLAWLATHVAWLATRLTRLATRVARQETRLVRLAMRVARQETRLVRLALRAACPATRPATRAGAATRRIYFALGTFSQSARNFFRPASVNGCFASCSMTA